MKIKEFISQHRRDFTAIYVCQHCGHEHTGSGYDDENFHRNVVPSLKCPECGKTAEGAKEEYRPLTTKYPEGMQV